MKLRLKYGFKMFLRNPVRMIASFLTAATALGIAGMCIFTQNYNTVDWERELYFQYYDEKYINIITSMNWLAMDTGSLDSNHFEKFKQIGAEYAYLYQTSSYSLTNPETVFGAYRLSDHFAASGTYLHSEYRGKEMFAPYADCMDGTGGSWSGAAQKIYNDLYRTLTIYSSEQAVEEFGYELIGRLPETKSEVAVPQWMYNCFLCYGYQDRAGNIFKVEREADLLGKTITLTDRNPEPVLMDATIVGIVHSDLEEEGFLEDGFWWRDEDVAAGRVGLNSTFYPIPPHIGLIISQEYWDSRATAFHENVNGFVVTLREGPYAEEIFEYLVGWQREYTYWDYRSSYIVYPTYKQPILGPSGITLYALVNQVYYDTKFYFDIIPFLSIFAAVLLMYLCFSTIMGKRRGVGIMQSMGANKLQVMFMIGVPIFLFCLLCSCGGTGIEIALLNQMNATCEDYAIRYGMSLTNIYPFTISWQTWLFTFGVPLLIAAVTTLVTVWLVFRTPVVDNLNKKDFRLFRKKVKTNPFTNLPWSGT